MVTEVDPGDGDAGRQAGALITASPQAHYTQYPQWAAIDTEVADARFRLFQVRNGADCEGLALARMRKLPGLPFRVADVPGGPVVRHPQALPPLLQAVREAMLQERVATLDVSPYVGRDEETNWHTALVQAGFQPLTGQPMPATLEVDLSPGAEGILAGFRKSYRPLVRRVLREDSLQVRNLATGEDVEAFQRMYDAMVAKGATPRPSPFFRDLLDFLERAPARGFALLACQGDLPLAGTFVLRHGPRAIYAFGATAALHPELPKGAFMQYAAMCRAHQDGASTYDLNGFTMGTGEPGSRNAVQQVNFWKSGLGGQPRPLMGPWQATLRPVPAILIRTARRLAASLKSGRR